MIVASKKNFLKARRSIPPTKWTGVSTPQLQKSLTSDMVTMQNALRGEAMTTITTAHSRGFDDQLQDFMIRATQAGNRQTYLKEVNPDLVTPETLAAIAAILIEAARYAFINTTVIEGYIRGVYQSLIDRSYTRTRYLFGEADGEANPNLSVRNENRMREAKKISATSFNVAAATIKKIMTRTFLLAQEGWNSLVKSVADTIRDKILAPTRLATISRTEGQRTVDEGVKEAAKLSRIVTHMSVIGCQAVEPDIPTYNGIPTCNIQNVPSHDVDAVEFHVNHTGVWIPTRFAPT